MGRNGTAAPDMTAKELGLELGPPDWWAPERNGTTGQAPKPVDLNLVRHLASLGLTDAQIANGLGMHRDTFTKRLHNNPESRFAEYYRQGRFKGQVRVASRMAKVSESDSKGGVIALLFSAKNVLGWQDVRTNVHSGSIQHVHSAVGQAWEMLQGRLPSGEPAIEIEGEPVPESGDDTDG